MQGTITITGESGNLLKRRNNVVQSRSPPSFKFVNAYPRSDSERTGARALIRANASKIYWRRVKQADYSSNTVHTLLQEIRWPETSHTSSAQAIATLESDDWCVSVNESDDPNVGDDQPQMSSFVQGPQSCPIDLLGMGHIDPFEVYQSELPKEIVTPLLAQVFRFLPQGFPPDQGSRQSSAANALLQKCFSQRGLFHAYLLCQFARNRAHKALTSHQGISKRDSDALMTCHLETLKAINKAFRNASTACTDDNILAVWTLAISGNALTEIPSRSPRQGPLKALTALHIYGSGLLVSTHAAGVRMMVSMRGGLQNVELPGLAYTISFLHIIEATRNLKRPLVPFASTNPDVEDHLSTVRPQSYPLCNLGSGFKVLHRVLSPQMTALLYPVLCRLCEYTLVVHEYVECRSEDQSLGLIGDERNFVQHSLMSLIPDEESAALEQEHPLYNLCRSAAIIYSLIVVFPLPIVTAPFAKLGVRIKEQILSPAIQTVWNEAPQLMLWINVLGAIASLGLPERSYFVSVLDRLVHRLKIDSWDGMRDHLQNFLWFGSTSDVDGSELWKEIEHSNSFGAW